MKKLLIDNRYFLIPHILFLLIFLIFAFLYSKTEMHIWANQIHAPFFDTFFKFTTYLGDGAVVLGFVIALLFIKYRYALTLLFAGLLIGGIVHLFKKILLEEMYRPSKYFELFETHKLYLIEGINLRSLQSFPSGHSATAFNVFFMLALITNNHFLKFCYFSVAMIVAFSRVYLSQHFFIDIAVGSVIAVVFMLLIFYWSQHWKGSWLESSLILDKK